MEASAKVATIESSDSLAEKNRQAPEAVTPSANSTPMPGRVIQLDFARGVAILAVMEFHFHSVKVHNPVAFGFDFVGKRIGWMGVDLFFVLSGFLVGGLLVQELLKTQHIQVGRFLFRRMMKIWPAYYAYIVFQMVVRKHPIRTFLWQNLLNIQNYVGTSLNHTWSLAVEEHFYLLLPFCLLFLYRRPWARNRLVPIFAVGLLLVMCGRFVSVFALHSGDTQLKTHSRIDGLLFGVALSWIFYTQRRRFDLMLSHRLWLTGILLVGLLLGLLYGHGTKLMWTIGYTVTYFSLGALLFLIYGYAGRLTKTFVYKTVAAIGVYSYGIYLWHLSVRDPLAELCKHLPHSVQWGSLLVSQYVAAIILGVLTTKAVEFPMLRIRDRLMPRGPAHLAPAHP
jgi:peptidoglycan/LPS O-acetylase OafA/YrhL